MTKLLAKQDRVTVSVYGTDSNPYATNTDWVFYAVYPNEHEAHDAAERCRMEYTYAKIVVETVFK